MAALTSFQFTAEDLRQRDGQAICREEFGNQILRLDLEALPNLPFHCEVSTLALPQARVTYSLKSGLSSRRTRRFLTDGVDDLSLLLNTSGQCLLASRSRDVLLEPGEAALSSAAEVTSSTTASPGHSVSIRLPRAAVASLAHNPEDTLLQKIPRDSEAVKLLAGYAQALRTSPLSSASLQGLAASHLRDLVAAAIGVVKDRASSVEQGGLRAARLRAVKAYVTQRIGAYDLPVAAAAAACGLSPRYVQTLFEGEGTTFSAFVLRQRLDRAHRMLADPGNLHRRIVDIALDAGFGDLSYFNKSFRRRYGAKPSDIRASAISTAATRGRTG